MIRVADEDATADPLLLEMTLQTQGCVPLVQHPLIHRSVRRVAADAAFAHRFVLEHERTSLRGVTLQAGFVRAQKSEAPTFDSLLESGAAEFDRISLMRVVTIDTAHLVFQHRVMVWQFEFRPDFQVTLETGLR
jgi:hypothetical protein